jgi:hypothetical protein
MLGKLRGSRKRMQSEAVGNYLLRRQEREKEKLERSHKTEQKPQAETEAKKPESEASNEMHETDKQKMREKLRQRAKTRDTYDKQKKEEETEPAQEPNRKVKATHEILSIEKEILAREESEAEDPEFRYLQEVLVMNIKKLLRLGRTSPEVLAQSAEKLFRLEETIDTFSETVASLTRYPLFRADSPEGDQNIEEEKQFEYDEYEDEFGFERKKQDSMPLLSAEGQKITKIANEFESKGQKYLTLLKDAEKEGFGEDNWRLVEMYNDAEELIEMVVGFIGAILELL